MDDRRDGIKEKEMFLAAEFRNRPRKRRGCQRSAGNDGRTVWNRPDFFTDYFDPGMIFDPFGDKLCEEFTVDSKGTARRQSRLFGTFQKHRAKQAGFVLEQTRGTVGQVGAKRVRADEFSQIVSLMCASLQGRPHFVEVDVKPALGSLPGSFTPCQPAANNNQVSHEGDFTILPLQFPLLYN